jgi:two-component system, NarL family, sensor kinase
VKKPLTILIVWIFAVSQQQNVWAQEHEITAGFEERKKKALKELEQKRNPDTARVKALMNLLGTSMINKQKKELDPYYQEAISLSRELEYSIGLSFCYRWKGIYYWGQKEYEAAHIYLDSSINVGNIPNKENIPVKLQREIGESHRKKGLVYVEQDNFYAALNHFFEALKYYEKEHGFLTVMIYKNISDTYGSLFNMEQSLFYVRKAVQLCETYPELSLLRAQSYLSLVMIYTRKKDFDMAGFYLEKMKPLMPDPVELIINSGYYISNGHFLFERKAYDSALYNFQRGLYYADKSNHSINKAASLNYLYKTSMKLGRIADAKKYLDQQQLEAEKTGARISQIYTLLNRSDYYSAKGEYARAYSTLKEVLPLKDSFIDENNILQINRLAAIYESDKKKSEIILLQHEKFLQATSIRQKSLFNKVAMGAIAILLVLAYLVFRHFTNKQHIQKQQQEIQQQRIKELEKDKQLLTIEAMLKGQEEERSRIAKDLHDGLGGLLSGVKLSFMSIREKMPVSEQSELGFDHSTKMLDRTIVELRKVAHNLMPEILMKFGLEEALNEFCHSIETSSGIHVIYQQLGKERKLSSAAESAVYRIVQELVNNVLKHAEASQVVVQLTKHPEKVTIAVEDNGIGFDTAALLTKTGAGILNIQHRVNYFKGMIDIDSEPGKGTSVTIELFT